MTLKADMVADLAVFLDVDDFAEPTTVVNPDDSLTALAAGLWIEADDGERNRARDLIHEREATLRLALTDLPADPLNCRFRRTARPDETWTCDACVRLTTMIKLTLRLVEPQAHAAQPELRLVNY